MVVKSNGDVGIGTTTPIEKLHVAGNVLAVAHLNISDKRFKKDIRQLENVMGNIQQLEGYSYQYRTEEFRNKGFSEGNQVGLIAQNVEKVYPELVKTYEDGYKAVNYDGLIPVLIEGIKEQQQQISSLEEENANIRREIEELKGLIELVRTEFNESSTAINRTRVDLGNTQSIVLNQNSPNPFKERTTIGYVVPDNIEKAHIFIFDLNGQIMKKVELPSGEGVLEVFASDLSSGMYSYSLVIDGNVVDTKKMTVTK